MSTYLFVTSRDKTPERVEKGFDVPWWSCSSTTQIGDTALVYVTGVGIEYEWRITKSAEPHDEWKYICDVEYFRTFDPPIALQEILEHVSREDWAPPHLNFRGYKSLQVPEEVADRIRRPARVVDRLSVSPDAATRRTLKWYSPATEIV